ncbi:MAG: ATPase [Thermoplasmata archaeon]|nr:MAG: ATPase [Thermoplasmata archaeon]
MHITFAGGKGGVGKSTVASSVMYYLRKDLDFIAVDADADAPNLHIIFGVDKPIAIREIKDSKVAFIDENKCVKCGICYQRCPYKSIDVIEGKYIIDPMTCEGCGVCAYFCPVNAIDMKTTKTGDIMLYDTKYEFKLISAQLDVGRPNSGKLVTIERLWANEIATEQGIKYVLIDAAAGIGCQVIASITGAKYVFLIAEDTPTSLHDVIRAYRVAEHFRIRSSLIVNKVGMTKTSLIKRWAHDYGIEIIGEIPYDSSVPRALSMMKPLPEAFPKSKASKALREISESVLDILKGL